MDSCFRHEDGPRISIRDFRANRVSTLNNVVDISRQQYSEGKDCIDPRRFEASMVSPDRRRHVVGQLFVDQPHEPA